MVGMTVAMMVPSTAAIRMVAMVAPSTQGRLDPRAGSGCATGDGGREDSVMDDLGRFGAIETGQPGGGPP